MTPSIIGSQESGVSRSRTSSTYREEMCLPPTDQAATVVYRRLVGIAGIGAMGGAAVMAISAASAMARMILAMRISLVRR